MKINETNKNEIELKNNLEIEGELFEGERALFKASNLTLKDCSFFNGESPLKESENIKIYNGVFGYKYPIWYSKNVYVFDSTFLDTARSGIWYTKDITIKDSTIAAPKLFRRCDGVKILNSTIPHADETLWNSKNIELKNVSACGNYFGFNSENINAEEFEITGNYVFDGAKNITVSNSKLISKDAFWNCENVTVKNTTIIGEYLGWNSKNITFIDCIIESDQGLCYMDNVKLINCRLVNTKLSFEYVSNIDATISNVVDGIKNPISGVIKAKGCKELIMDETKINPEKTEVILEDSNV